MEIQGHMEAKCSKSPPAAATAGILGPVVPKQHLRDSLGPGSRLPRRAKSFVRPLPWRVWNISRGNLPRSLEYFTSEINDKDKEVLMFRMAYGRDPPCLPDVAEIFYTRLAPQQGSAKQEATTGDRFKERT